jgi:hypothetical protein
MTRSGTPKTVDTGSQFNGRAAGNGQTLEHADLAPPPLSISPSRPKTWFRIGYIVAILDVPIMPFVYFYALRNETSLFLKRKLLIFGPLGWTRWGLVGRSSVPKFIPPHSNIQLFTARIPPCEHCHYHLSHRSRARHWHRSE